MVALDDILGVLGLISAGETASAAMVGAGGMALGAAGALKDGLWALWEGLWE